MASAKKSRKQNPFLAKRKVRKGVAVNSTMHELIDDIESYVAQNHYEAMQSYGMDSLQSDDSATMHFLNGYVDVHLDKTDSNRINVNVYVMQEASYADSEDMSGVYRAIDTMIEYAKHRYPEWSSTKPDQVDWKYEEFGKSTKKSNPFLAKRKVKKYSESEIDVLDDIFNELQRTLLRFSVTDSERKFTNECADITGALNNLGSSLYHERSMLDEGYADWYNGTSKSKKSKTRVVKRKVQKMITDPQDTDLDLIANAIFYGGIPEVTIQQPYENPNFGVVSAEWDGYAIIVDYDEYPSIRMKFRTQEERNEHAMDEFYEPTDIIDLIQAVVEDVTFFNKNNEDYYSMYSNEDPFLIKGRANKSATEKALPGIIELKDALEAEGIYVYLNGSSIHGTTELTPFDVYFNGVKGIYKIDCDNGQYKEVESISEVIDFLNSQSDSYYDASAEDVAGDVQAPQDDLTDIEKTIASKRMKDGSMGDLEKFANGGPLVGQFQPYANNYRTVTMGRNTMSPLPPKMKRI